MTQNRVFIASLFILAGAVAGCSSAPGTRLAPDATNAVNSFERAAHPVTTASPWRNLYVRTFTCPNLVTVYPPGQTSPSRIIGTTKCPRYFSSIAFDASGNMYASMYAGHRVRIFAPGATSPFRAIWNDLKEPSDVLVDHAGRVFVSNDAAPLAVFAPRQNRVVRTLPYVGTPWRMLVDSEDYFYLAVSGMLYAYSPGGAKLLYQLEGRHDAPLTAALDPNNNLYVTKYFSNSITVYNAHSTKVLRTITRGVNRPWELQFDANGNLYCLNTTSVTVFPPGASTPSFTIKDGMDGPFEFTVDSAGTLYVFNDNANNVTVYPPGSTEPSETITNGVDDAASLAIGP
jgi:YVTN family beta-propeller protein